MLKTFVAGINRFLRRTFSVELRRVVEDGTHEPIDLSDQCSSPIEAYYIANASPHYVDVPLERCRHLRPMAFPCKVGVGDPFIETVTAYMRGSCSSYEDSPLFDYYSNWQPSTVADVIGISARAGLEGSPLAYVAPWLEDNPDRKYEKRARVNERENRLHGADLSISEGHKAWGPASRAKGKLEFRRLIETYLSIKKMGYVRGMGHQITGEVLVRDQDWRVFIGPGQHRVAVLTALDYETVPVCFCNRHRQAKGWPDVIRREDVHCWPHVRSGIYTVDEALSVFDRVFEGQQPPAYLKAIGRSQESARRFYG